ncbi:MAG: hypothetical protein ACTTJ6_03800 [Treponema sp.]
MKKLHKRGGLNLSMGKKGKYLYKLWWGLALGALVLVFGCKQSNSAGNGSNNLNEITIAVKGDNGIAVEKPGYFTAIKGSDWKSVKDKATDMAKEKLYTKIIDWHLNEATGELLKDEMVLKTNVTVFAVTKKEQVTITVVGDSHAVISGSNKVVVDRGSKWEDIRARVISIATINENFEVIGMFKDKANNYSPINDTIRFIVDDTVFLRSSRKKVQYKVEHCLENIDDDEFGIIKYTEEKVGEAGLATEAEAKQYDNFACLHFDQETIKADGSTILKIKYKRNRASLIIDLDGGETLTQLESGNNGKKLLKGKFEAKVAIKEPTKEGFAFIGWKPALPTNFPEKDDTTVYVAKWGNNVLYRVDIEGDERVEVLDVGYIEVPIATPKTIGQIRAEIEAKIKLKDEYSSEDYTFYD